MLTLFSKPLLLLESLWYLYRWDWVIRKQPFEKWQQSLNSATSNQSMLENNHSTASSALSVQSIQGMRKSIEAIVRRSPRELNCMRRCLALKSMIERRKGHVVLHIGVKIEPQSSTPKAQSTVSKLRAHAWLSINGQVINDTQDVIEQYQEITHGEALFSKLARSDMPEADMP